MHLVDFTVEIYCESRPHGRQIFFTRFVSNFPTEISYVTLKKKGKLAGQNRRLIIPPQTNVT